MIKRESNSWDYDPEVLRQGEHGEDLTLIRVNCLMDLIDLRNEAREAEQRLRLVDGRSLLTRKFIIESAGNTSYDFPHKRLKLVPKNRRLPQLHIINPTLRFVGEGEESAVFIDWVSHTGAQKRFYLDQDSFYRLVKNDCDGLEKQPTSLKDYDYLQVMINNFEPGLQDNGSDVA